MVQFTNRHIFLIIRGRKARETPTFCILEALLNERLELVVLVSDSVAMVTNQSHNFMKLTVHLSNRNRKTMEMPTLYVTGVGILSNGRLKFVVFVTLLPWQTIKSHIFIKLTALGYHHICMKLAVFWVISLIISDRKTDTNMIHYVFSPGGW